LKRRSTLSQAGRSRDRPKGLICVNKIGPRSGILPLPRPGVGRL
jgi:hypothetical protein